MQFLGHMLNFSELGMVPPELRNSWCPRNSGDLV